MSYELSPSRERPSTLLEIAPNEKLIKVADLSTNLHIVDGLFGIIAARHEREPTLENLMALEHMAYRQSAVLEINELTVDYNAPENAEIAMIEQINEALFKPFGQRE